MVYLLLKIARELIDCKKAMGYLPLKIAMGNVGCKIAVENIASKKPWFFYPLI